MAKESSAPSAVRFQWQHTMEAALYEPDPNKRREKVYDAEAAIFSRLQELVLTERLLNPELRKTARQRAFREL
jgi:hypothetical protein